MCEHWVKKRGPEEVRFRDLSAEYRKWRGGHKDDEVQSISTLLTSRLLHVLN